MKKFVMAAFCTVTFVSLVMAEDYTLQILKINNDGTVSGTKVKAGKGKGGGGGFGFGKGEPVTVKLAKNVKIYKGKYDTDAKAFAKDGDDLGLTGLKAAYDKLDPVTVTVGGTALTAKDMLEVCIKDGKACAKLNGKDVDINTVAWKNKAPLVTRVTTDDDGNVTQVLITGGGGNKGKKKDAN